MPITDLIKSNRSYRRFVESEAIDELTLRDLVELARCSASAANLQPLKYVLSNTPEKNSRIFPAIAWAGYLTDWGGPKEGERPSAYIIMLADKEIGGNPTCDSGIAAQSILLGAVENGYGGCMIGAINRDLLRQNLEIPANYDIALIVALGRPAETVILEDMDSDGSIKYYRDAEDIHHVPKRRLEDILLDF